MKTAKELIKESKTRKSVVETEWSLELEDQFIKICREDYTKADHRGNGEYVEFVGVNWVVRLVGVFE